jgi:hypothetical protein
MTPPYGYRRKWKAQMGAKSRGEAVRMALENEWFTIHEIEAAIDDE